MNSESVRSTDATWDLGPASELGQACGTEPLTLAGGGSALTPAASVRVQLNSRTSTQRPPRIGGLLGVGTPPHI